MNTKIMMAVALVAMAAFCLAPLAESEAVYYNVDGDSVIGTENKAEYTISYSNHDYDSYADVNMSVTYSAKLVDSSGSTVSSGVQAHRLLHGLRGQDRHRPLGRPQEGDRVQD